MSRPTVQSRKAPKRREARRYTPRSRAAWRAWLESHHASEAEVWLVFYKRHAAKPTVSYDEAVEEAVCFGWIDGVKRRIDDARYEHRFSPRKAESRWSATNRKRAARMEKAGLMTEAGRKAIRAAKRKGTWHSTPPKVDLALPPELAARLEQDTTAAEFFASLAPSYQQQFIGWINIAKRDATRQRRLDETMKLLARGEKLGMR